jgi:hypothetical protein
MISETKRNGSGLLGELFPPFGGRGKCQYNPPVLGRTAPAAESGETGCDNGAPLAESAPITE